MNSGAASRRFCPPARRAPRAAARPSPTGRASRASSSCSRPASSGSDLPQEMGCGSGHDVLAPAPRLARRPASSISLAAAQSSRELRQGQTPWTGSRAIVDASLGPRQGRGAVAQRGRPGPPRRTAARPSTKRHLVTDRAGRPARPADHVRPTRTRSPSSPALLDAIPPVRGRGGPPAPPAHRGSMRTKRTTYRVARRALRRARHPGAHRPARHRLEHRGSGRHRWVVERTFAHLNQMRRLAVRYEQRADIYAAFLTLGCALLAFNHLTRLC